MSTVASMWPSLALTPTFAGPWRRQIPTAATKPRARPACHYFSFSDIVVFATDVAHQPETMIVAEVCDMNTYVVLRPPYLYSVLGRHLRKVGSVPREAYAEVKLRILFCGESADVRSRLRFDDVSLYSVTNQFYANAIAQHVRALPGVTSDTGIVDGTSCIGGNTASFARVFDLVDAVEIDRSRCDMLRHNLNVLGLPNVNVLHDDICVRYRQFPKNRSIIFLDPPWGGRQYKRRKSVQLWLGRYNVASFIRRHLIHVYDWVTLKVPKNFDTVHFRLFVTDWETKPIGSSIRLIVVDCTKQRCPPPAAAAALC